MAWFENSGHEQAYKRWLLDHPEGFVLNHPRGSTASGNIAHRASCDVMGWAAERTSAGQLTNNYIKFCSLTYEDLAVALDRRTPGAELMPCKKCKPFSGWARTAMRNWWVSHSQSFNREVGGGYIWCPQVLDGDKKRVSWLNVSEVQPGDRIFSYAKQKIQAIGTAQTAAYDAPPSEGHSSWSGMGWKVDVVWRPLDEPVSPKDHITAIRPHLPEKHSPLGEDGRGNIVYLVAISDDLADVLLGAAARKDAVLQDDLDRSQIETSEPEQTVRQALYLARIGQGLFKKRVGKIESSCRLTGVEDALFLTASHIKPWRASSNAERLDGHNGLLLAPHVDRLFDRGDISFDDAGSLLVRDQRTADIMKAWRLPVSGNFGPFLDEQRAYLAYHRKHVFATGLLSC